MVFKWSAGTAASLTALHGSTREVVEGLEDV
jgi:hypothetical protein